MEQHVIVSTQENQIKKIIGKLKLLEMAMTIEMLSHRKHYTLYCLTVFRICFTKYFDLRWDGAMGRMVLNFIIIINADRQVVCSDWLLILRLKFG